MGGCDKGGITIKANQRENARYSSGYRIRLNKARILALEMLPDCPEDRDYRILDAGCGSGEISVLLQQRGYNVIGIDFSEVAVQLAREAGVDAFQADFDLELKFPDKSFDAVICFDVLEHLFDPMNALAEFRRILKDEGILVLTVPHIIMSLRGRLSILRGRAPQHGTYRRFRQCKHHTIFSVDLLRFMLTEEGFEVEKIVGVRGNRKIHTCIIMTLFAKDLVALAKVR